MQFKVVDELPKMKGERDEPVDWAAAKQAMIDNAGEWLLLAENISSSTPHQLRTGKYKLFKGHELDDFEFVVRKPENPEVPYGNRKTDLYGRYIAEGVDA